MEFSYSPRLADIKERAAALTGRLAAYEDEVEREGGLPESRRDEVVAMVRDSGFLAMNAPEKWGGGGLGWLEQIVAESEFGRLTNGMYLAVERPALAMLAATDAQRERFLLPEIRGERVGGRAFTEPQAGSDPTMFATSAVRSGAGFRISGEKWFVTLGDIADYLIVMAIVQPEMAPTLFLVDKDRPGVCMKENPRYMHTFAFGHPHFTLDDVEVGPDEVLGDVGGGWQLVQETVSEERVVVAAHTLGAAERALELASNWARERVQGGERLIRQQLIQSMLADSAIDLTLARTYLHRLGWELDQGQDPKTAHAKVALAKVAASEAAGRIVDRAVQIFGGRGYLRDNPVERLYREVRVDRIWMGTSEIQRMAVANQIDKRGYRSLVEFADKAASDVSD